MGANQKRRGGAEKRALRQQGAKQATARVAGRGGLTATALPNAETLAPPTRRGGWRDTIADVPQVQVRANWWARRRTDVLISALFVVVALGLYLVRIEEPRQYIYDEVYHAYTASQYAIGNADAWLWSTKAPRENVAYEWTHPPLGKLIMTVGVLMWGDTPLGWRFTSAIFGALGLAAVYWLGLTLTGRRSVAILAGVLTLADGLYFVESRTGVIDIFGTIFMACAFVAFYAFLTAAPTKIRTPLLWLGLFMGLGIATKWNAVYPSALLGVFAAWRAFCLFPFNARRTIASLVAALFAIAVVFVPALRSGAGLKLSLLIAAVIAWQLYMLYASSTGQQGPKGAGEGFVQHLLWVPLGLIVLPLALYLASYVPFFLAGHTVDQLIELQRQMYYYHSHLKATHAYQSTWYQWPVVWRPVWYSVTYGQGVVANTYANGNPLLYWAFLPAVGYLTARWWADRHPALPVLVIGFFGQWLPWALIPRIAYIYHFLPAAIFGIFAVAVVVDELWEWGRKEFAGKALAVGYVTVVVVAFVFFYPIYSSVNLTKPEFESRIWFEHWR
ncbi:MAG TPA: phospholipid carrier-dependent glycosyltransferase [Thermomicrobiales bacterium]